MQSPNPDPAGRVAPYDLVEKNRVKNSCVVKDPTDIAVIVTFFRPFPLYTMIK